MNKYSGAFKATLLFLLLLSSSVSGAPVNRSKLNLLDVHFVYTQKLIFAATNFAQRKRALVELESALLELKAQDYKGGEWDEHTSLALEEIATTFKLISISQLKDDNCARALTKIHVGFDPTMEGTPRLPYYIQQLYSFIIDTCLKDQKNSPSTGA